MTSQPHKRIIPEPPEMPEKVSLAWLYRHVPVQAWVALGGALVTAAGIGVAIGRLPLLNDSSSKVAPAVIQLSSETVQEIKLQMQALTEAHNKRMDALNQAYLTEETKAADEKLIGTYQRDHAAAAIRMKAAMQEERQAFDAQIAAVRSLLAGGAKR